MSLFKSPVVVARRAATFTILGAFALLLSTAGTAYADGMSDPDQARAQCEKWGKAGTPEELKKCCGNLILVADMKQQRKLEAQCAAPKSSTKPAKAVPATS